MKRITALFLSILLLLSLCVTALGHEAPDLTKKGTITIQWKFQGDALPDGALRAYRVGTLKDTDGNFSFAPAGTESRDGLPSGGEDPDGVEALLRPAGYAAGGDEWCASPYHYPYCPTAAGRV